MVPAVLPEPFTAVSPATTRPADFRADLACSRVLPVRDGMANGFGPDDTTTVTLVPSLTSAPAPGVERMTLPASTDSEISSVRTGSSPSARRADSASLALRPASDGTVAGRGPLLTVSVTAEPATTR